MPQCSVDLDHYREGIELFNRADFFDAHEVLEDVWRTAPVGEKKFLQRNSYRESFRSRLRSTTMEMEILLVRVLY